MFSGTVESYASYHGVEIYQCTASIIVHHFPPAIVFTIRWYLCTIPSQIPIFVALCMLSLHQLFHTLSHMGLLYRLLIESLCLKYSYFWNYISETGKLHALTNDTKMGTPLLTRMAETLHWKIWHLITDKFSVGTTQLNSHMFSTQFIEFYSYYYSKNSSSNIKQKKQYTPSCPKNIINIPRMIGILSCLVSS